MKKLYFLSVLCILICICSNGATYYSAAGSNVNFLASWGTVSGGTGTHPTTFAAVGDTFIINNSVTCDSAWTIGTGAALPNTYTSVLEIVTGGAFLAGGSISITIYGHLQLSGTGYISASAGSPNYYLYGNLSFAGTSYITNSPAYNYVYFANTSATYANPQIYANTSTGFSSGNWTYWYINAACFLKLAGSFPNNGYPLTCNGTLICPYPYVVTGSGSFILSASTGGLFSGFPQGIITAGITGVPIQVTGSSTLPNSSTYGYCGTGPQVTGSGLFTALLAPSSLVIDNPAGVTLSQSTTTTGTLQFINGILTVPTGTSLTTPGAPGNVTGAGSGSYVKGTLTKNTTGYASVNFEVGDTDYAPLSLTFSGAGGTASVKSTYGLHPMVASSGLNTAFMANHYWTISGALPSLTPKATYNSTDIIGGSNAAFLTQRFNGSAWLGAALTTTNTSAPYTSTPTTLVTSPFGDYIFGNNSCGTLPITGPTSVCSGSSVTLADATTGGSWSSSATTVATISTAGIVTGIAPGTTTITYSASGCIVTSVISVVTAPVAGTLSGAATLCTGSTATVSPTLSGGLWGSTNTAVATVNTSGVVTGIAAGSAVIVYSVTNACGTATATHSVTVYSTPTVSVTGGGSIYSGSSATLTATGGTTYTWTPPATLSASTGSTVIADPTATTHYTVTGTNASGCSSAAVVTLTVTLRPCSIPSSIISSSITTTAATISWMAVTGATGYMLGYQAYGATCWTYMYSAGTTITLASLLSGTAYNYEVRTICGSGDSSGYSTINTFATLLVPCGTPTAVTAFGITTTTATISWTAVTGAVSYILAYKTSAAPSWTTVSVAGTSYSLTGLTGATIYQYELRSVCGAADSSGYTSYSTFATLGGLPTCPTPSGLTSVLTASLAVVSWTAVPGASGYMVTYQLVTRGTPVTLFTPTNSLALSGLTLSSSYEYRVRSVCGAGDTSAVSPYTTFRDITSGFSTPPSEGTGEAIYPNPTSEKFTIAYHLAESLPVTIVISNTFGQTVALLSANEMQDAGDYQLTFTPVASGLYIVRMMLGNEVYTEKVVKW